MKVAIITDTHAGVRGDNSVFLDNQEQFYSEIFFPKLKEEGIDTVLHLGDVFDRRKSINFVTLSRVKKMFFNPLRDNGIKVHVVAGNHDVVFKNTNEVNSLSLLMPEYDNWDVCYDVPKEIKLGNCNILLSPWISQNNYAKSMKAFAETKATVLMGHFEFQGFEMIKGSISQHGLDKKDFSKFDIIYSGHFHHPSEISNVRYLGAPFEMDWSDYNGERGFHIFDTETRKLTFVKNHLQLHHKVEYDDEDMTVEYVEELDVSIFKNTFIKLIVLNKTKPYVFDLLLDKIADSGCTDLKVIEDALNLERIGEEELVDETKDTQSVMHSYIESIDITIDKNNVKRLVDDIYGEAMSL